jgi:hypothetical protein
VTGAEAAGFHRVGGGGVRIEQRLLEGPDSTWDASRARRERSDHDDGAHHPSSRLSSRLASNANPSFVK